MTTSTTPLFKFKSTKNLCEYYDALQASVPGMRQRTNVIEKIHRKANAKARAAAAAKLSNTANAASAPKSAPSPVRRTGPGALIKYTAIPPPSSAPKFTLVDDDEKFLDDEIDGPVSADCRDWWNKASVEERLVWLACAHSADLRKAYAAYRASQDAAARQEAEDAQAAERCMRNVVAMAKARAAEAAAA